MRTAFENSYAGIKIEIQGAVQGVGFRPFVYRLATDLGLMGKVYNSSSGVNIEIEGRPAQLQKFQQRLQQEAPPLATIAKIKTHSLKVMGVQSFNIEKSQMNGNKTSLILPDIATCGDCHHELFDPHNRRYLYPFTNCTNCGPRFSIIQNLPYDRSHTTMNSFNMCQECSKEYQNPQDRRFHAQPNACFTCGPHLELWDKKGKILASNHNALEETVNAIKRGLIVAIKGLGGFHLVADAQNRSAIQKLRKRKNRKTKPFALMYPSMEMIDRDCKVCSLERKLLLSPAAPIVLLAYNFLTVAQEVAFDSPYLGIMLPYTPLHHILIKQLSSPIIATSGNLSGNAICTDEKEALQSLPHIADLFLVHNRPIAWPLDDSIVQVVMGREMVLRRARGFAPLPIEVNNKFSLLAVGGHMKNAIAFSLPKQIFLSQYIGDLDSEDTWKNFLKIAKFLPALYDNTPANIVGDLHPDYPATVFAQNSGIPCVLIQHHYAHILSCMAENKQSPPALGICWDGTGYGADSTIWGGEFLLIKEASFQRLGHLRYFSLPGGEKAIKEPARIAIGILYEIFGEQAFTSQNLQNMPCFQPYTLQQLKIIRQMLLKKINTPQTSSMGRFFDAISSLLGICHRTYYEGEAAIKLELATVDVKTSEYYPIATNFKEQSLVLDWKPIVLKIIEDYNNNIDVKCIAAKFHNTLANAIGIVCKKLKAHKIFLSGGCFQNRYLTETTIAALRKSKLDPYWHRYIPPNDGGIALGQIVAAIQKKEKTCV